MSFAVVFTPEGPVAPTYADILAFLKQQMRAIYGSDIYLEPDGQDAQMLAIFATAIKAENDSLIAAYNSFSPATAQGVGLSNVVLINGIRRLVSSNSQVIQRVSGSVGLTINGGQVCDPNNTDVRWALPAVVGPIPDAGYLDVTATCLTAGAVVAGSGTLTRIVTPVRNWQSTTNTDDATPGNPVESDATLRQRQSQSTAIPALSVVDAIQGALENLIGVARALVYENDTGITDGNGILAHSICAVVQGGDAMTIAKTIQRYKTPGTGTFGDTSETVSDGIAPPIVIKFQPLDVIAMAVLAFATAEDGYADSTTVFIQQALAFWFNAAAIGQDSLLSKLWSPINLMGDSATGGTGQAQALLDSLSNTYNASAIYQARPNMAVVGGYVAGNTAITVQAGGGAFYANGQQVALKLDSGAYLRTTVNGAPAGDVVTLAAAIPGGRTVAEGTLLYVSGDIDIAFDEATSGAAANMTVEVS